MVLCASAHMIATTRSPRLCMRTLNATIPSLEIETALIFSQVSTRHRGKESAVATRQPFLTCCWTRQNTSIRSAHGIELQTYRFIIYTVSQ